MAFKEPFAEFPAGVYLMTGVAAFQAECNNKVTSSSIPTSGKVNEPLSYSVSSHVESGSCMAACGIGYDDGPAPSIKVVIDGKSFEVPKGYAAVIYYTSPVGSCTSISAGGTATFPTKGSYTIWLLAGYISGDKVYVTDKRVHVVTIEEVAPPTPPAPSPEIPLWVWLLMGFSIGTTIAALAAALTIKK